MIYWLTDEVGTILSIYNYDADGLRFATEQGLALARAFPDSDIYLHSGSFAEGNKPEVGMCSSMRGPTERIRSGYSTSRDVPDWRSGFYTNR